MRPGGALEFTPADLLGNDLNVDGDALSVTNVGEPSAGTLSYSAQTGKYSFSPGCFVGTATFTYRTHDGVETSPPATVSIEVVNTAPWAIGGSYQVHVGETLAVPSLVERGAAWDMEDAFSAVFVASNAVPPGAFQANGSFTFTAATPGTVTVDFKVTDGRVESDVATITIEVVDYLRLTADDEQSKYGAFTVVEDARESYPSNDRFTYTAPTIATENTPPAAANDGPYVVLHGTTITPGALRAPTLLFNDFDPDGNNTLSVTRVVTNGTNGNATVASNGDFSFVPSTQASGYDFVGSDSFEYEVTDGVNPPVTASVSVVFTNQDPIAKSETHTNSRSSNGIYYFSFPFSDPDGESLALAYQQPSVGSVSVYPGNYCVFTAPSSNWLGSVSMSYSVTDGAGASASGTVTLVVVEQLPGPQPWVLAQDDSCVWLGATVTGSVAAGDAAHDNRPLTFSASTTTGSYGNLSLSSNGSFTYSVTLGQETAFIDGGGEEFTYTATDDCSPTAHSATAKLSIKPRLLKPGEAAGLDGHIVYNGGKVYPYLNGLGSVFVWFEGNVVNLVPEGSDFLLEAEGGANDPTSVCWRGGGTVPLQHFLQLNADGDIFGGNTSNPGPVSWLNGHLNLSAGGAIGQGAEATTVRVTAGGDIGVVYASDRVFWANAGNYYNPTRSIASVTAAGSIYSVQVWGTLGPVESVNGDIGAISASGDIAGDVTAAGSLGCLYTGHDLLGNVTAGDDIGFFRLPLGFYGSMPMMGYMPGYEYPSLGGVFAGQTISGSITASGGSISVVDARLDVDGAVSAGKSVYFVRSEESSILKAISAGLNVGRVEADLDVHMQVTASQGHLGEVIAGRQVLGDLSAGKSLGVVLAGTELHGNIKANGGSIFIVWAGTLAQSDGLFHGRIEAGQISASSTTGQASIGQIISDADTGCGGDIRVGSIAAGTGFLGSIAADGVIEAAIQAALSIGCVWAGGHNPGDISGPITSTNEFIGWVKTERGGISGALTAGTDVGPVFARDTISGDIDAAGAVAGVTSERGSIAGVSGVTGVGNLTAGLDITGDITSAQAGIGDIVAGNFLPGNIQGSINANTSIHSIYAAALANSPSQPDDLMPFLMSILQVLYSFSGDAEIVLPSPPQYSGASSVAGNIAGSIFAGQSVGAVRADGNIQGDVTAGARLNLALARGDVDGNLQSAVSSIKAFAGGVFAGGIAAVGNIYATSYRGLNGDLTSSSGMVLANTAARTEGSVSGSKGVLVAAYDTISSPTVNSSQGPVVAISAHDVSSPITSAKTAAVMALGKYQGSLVSQHGKALVSTLGEIQAEIQAEESALLQSIKEIHAAVTAADAEITTADDFSSKGPVKVEKALRMYVKNTLDGSQGVGSSTGDVYINAEAVKGPITADQGRIAVNAYGDVEGTIHAGKDISILARGKLNSDITSDQGSVMIRADGEVGKSATANGTGGSIRLVAFDKVGATLTAEQGRVSAYVIGDLTGEVTAGTKARVFAWGKLSKPIQAGTDADVYAYGDVTASISAGDDVRLLCGANVNGEVTAGKAAGNATGAATVVARGSVLKKVTGQGAAVVDSMESVTTDVTAHAGGVSVTARGDYSGKISAQKNAAVSVGGQVRASQVKAGFDVSLSAHQGVHSVTVNADHDAVILSDTSLESSSILAKGRATVSALGALTGGVVVDAGLDVELFAGTSADVNATAKAGKIDATALQNLQGDFTAGRGLLVAAYGEISNLTATTQSGAASLFARGNVTATVHGAEAVTVTGLKDVSGTYDSSGKLTLYVGGAFNGAATGVRTVGVVAGNAVSGTVASSQGDASALSTAASGSSGGANVSAKVTAYRDASVTSLLGCVTGEVTATLGTAIVSAGAEVTQKVKAGHDAVVLALDDVSSSEVTANGNAKVVAFGNVKAKVTATGGHAIVLAGKDVEKDVTGALDALAVARTGKISGQVTAQGTDAQAVAMKEISGSVSGQRHAVAASLSKITGNVTAVTGSAVAAARGGTITGGVTAGQSVLAVALDSITGAVTAGTDAVVATLDSALGDVHAGRDALVISADSVSGTVEAQRHAVVLAFGTVTGNVSAVTGDAAVVTWGNLNNTISAGDSAYGFAGGNASVTISAAHDLFLESFGATTAMATAGQDGLLWSAGPLAGHLTAGRDAGAVSLATSTLDINAGQDAYLFVFDNQQGTLHAGRDAFVMALAGAFASLIAGRDAGVYSVDYALGNIHGNRYAGLVTWGTAAGPMIVDGNQGAFAWVYGDCNGQITSSDGNALLVVYGNALATTSAGQDTLVYAVGDFFGTVSADDDAVAITLGKFDGTLNAGSDGAIFSQGTVHASMHTGTDLLVYAQDDVGGLYHAGRDGSVITYGDFDATLEADRDVGGDAFSYCSAPGVWARGDIHGLITAGRNIGYGVQDQYASMGWYDNDIFSFGTIDALIVADNPLGLPDGGHIGTVAAWGPIAGTIKAGQSIGAVRSGDAATALLIAPQVPVAIEYDATIQADHPCPNVPASITAEVLAEAAAVYAQVLAARSDLAAEIQALLTAFAVAKGEEAAAITAARVQVQTDNAQTQVEIPVAVASARVEVLKARQAASQAAAAALKALRQAADKDFAELDKLRTDVQAQQDAAYQHWQERVQKTDAALAQANQDMSQTRQRALASSAQEKQQRLEHWRELVKAIKEEQRRRNATWWQNVLIGAGRFFTSTADMALLGTIDTVAIGLEAALRGLGFNPYRWESVSTYGQGTEQALQSGASVWQIEGEMVANLAKNVVTFGLWETGAGAVEWWETGDATRFQQAAGEWLAGAALAAATKATTRGRMGRTAGERARTRMAGAELEESGPRCRGAGKTGWGRAAEEGTGPRCFDGDTHVVLYDAGAFITETVADAGLPSDAPRISPLGLTCLTVGLGALPMLGYRRRRREEEDDESSQRAAVDALFGRSRGPMRVLADASADEVPNALCHVSRRDLHALCDRLFAGEESDWTNASGAAMVVEEDIEASLVRRATQPHQGTTRRANTKERAVLQERVAPTRTTLQPKALPQRHGKSRRVLCEHHCRGRMETINRNVLTEHPTSLHLGAGLWLVLFTVLGSWLCWRTDRASEGLGTPSVAAVASASSPVDRYATKPIRDVRVGDVVLARDEFGRELGLRRVVQVFRHTSDHLRILEFLSSDGSRQTLETTNPHPFWDAQRQAFVKAEHLAVGARVAGPGGEIQQLVSTVYEPHPEGTEVFNMEVEGHHTYFVAAPGAHQVPILVHNADACLGDAPEGGGRISNVPGNDFVPDPSITKPYARPSDAGPTAAQRAAVQGKPCVECGKVTPRQVADHIEPLSVEYYRTGTNDIARQSSVEAVQAHCRECSNIQGGLLSAFSRWMKQLLGL